MSEDAAKLARQEAAWQRKMEQIRAEMTAYAIKVAATRDDLDPDFETAGLEVWANSDE